MLCLTRKVDESIILRLEDGTHIKVTVADIVRQGVRIAISAPESVEIVREELLYSTTKGWKRGKDAHGKAIR